MKTLAQTQNDARLKFIADCKHKGVDLKREGGYDSALHAASNNSWARNEIQRRGHADISIRNSEIKRQSHINDNWKNCENTTNAVGDFFTGGAHRDLQSAAEFAQQGELRKAAHSVGGAAVRVAGTAVVQVVGGKVLSAGGRYVSGVASKAQGCALNQLAKAGVKVPSYPAQLLNRAGRALTTELKLNPWKSSSTSVVKAPTVHVDFPVKGPRGPKLTGPVTIAEDLEAKIVAKERLLNTVSNEIPNVPAPRHYVPRTASAPAPRPVQAPTVPTAPKGILHTSAGSAPSKPSAYVSKGTDAGADEFFKNADALRKMAGMGGRWAR